MGNMLGFNSRAEFMNKEYAVSHLQDAITKSMHKIADMTKDNAPVAQIEKEKDLLALMERAMAKQNNRGR